MPRSLKAKRSRRQPKEYQSPQETLNLSYALETAILSQFKPQIPYRKTFRFQLTTGVGKSTAWTTAMFLDMYAIAIGGSSSPVRIYNNMKLLGVKMWDAPTSVDIGADTLGTIGLEYSPSLIAGFGGAPRTPYTATSISTSKMAHICAKPKVKELASQWFSAQQASYAILNMEAFQNTVVQFDFLVTEVNGETPVATAYTSSVTKGTVGVTNFGVTGCRSIGLENLVNP